MLEAMKSLLGGSVGSHASEQLPPQTGANGQRRREAAPDIKNNPAVEINLSAQAIRIMEALEKGDLKINDQGKMYRENDPQVASYSPVNEVVDEDVPGPFQPLQDIIKEIVDTIEMGMLTAEEIADIDRLFDEIAATLQNTTVEEMPGSGEEDLTVYDQLKAVILFSELNRMLGNVGVFFGRDLSLAKMTASAQENANVMFGELSNTLGRGQQENMSTPQEARIDAIFRELEQLYARIESKFPDDIARKISSSLNSNAGFN